MVCFVCFGCFDLRVGVVLDGFAVGAVSWFTFWCFEMRLLGGFVGLLGVCGGLMGFVGFAGDLWVETLLEG